MRDKESTDEKEIEFMAYLSVVVSTGIDNASPEDNATSDTSHYMKWSRCMVIRTGREHLQYCTGREQFEIE